MDEHRNWGGRPRKYNSPEEFDAEVDKYVERCIENKEPLLWTGMALSMGFSSRTSIDEYMQYDGFSDSVKRAKTIVEMGYEKLLVTDGGSGPIFALKNFNWTDKQTHEHTSLDGSMGNTNITVTKEDLQDVLDMM